MLYSGVTGKISVKKGSGETVEVMHSSNWNVDLKREIGELSCFGNSWKEKLPGLKDWTAGLDGPADFETGNGQDDLFAAFDDGDLVECAFYLDANTFLKGTAYVESLSVKHAADGHAEATTNLTGNDGVLLNVPSSTPVSTVLGELDVTSVAGTASGDSLIKVDPSSPGSGNKFVYKLGTAYSAFEYDASLTTGWIEFTPGANGANIACGSSTKITVAEVTSGNKARGRGIAVLVKHA